MNVLGCLLIVSVPGVLALSVTEVDPNDWIRQCVPPYKQQNFPTVYINYSNYELIAQPSGLCADFLSCAFEDCEWSLQARQTFLNHDLGTVDINDIKAMLPPLNLPASIILPKSVREVVDAVAYANKNKMFVSIKSSGHSYHGSSTRKDSLLLNLRDFPKYSPSSIAECDLDKPTAVCKLADARGKRATVRVGGGELWDDVYRAVLAWNAQPRVQGYTVVGGGAGTVGAAGGWLQGGGLSTGLERRYGLGVDQVLELEMVLASGAHVRFGPSSWEQDAGFVYPRTTKVTGKCNTNVAEDESKWRWEVCKDDIPFADLWLAVRGGGGGTYGVLTAAHVQLHEDQGLSAFRPNNTAITALGEQCTADPTCNTVFENLFYDFVVDLFFTEKGLPGVGNVGTACGTPAASFSLAKGTLASQSGVGLFFCGGDVVDKVSRGWQIFASEVLTKIPALNPLDLQNFWNVVDIGSYAALLLAANDGTTFPAGHVPDYPPPATMPDNRPGKCWSALVPTAFLAQKNDDVHHFMANVLQSAHLTGGLASVAHDQMTAVPTVERHSSFELCIPLVGNLHKTYREKFLPFYPAAPAGSFPGGTEYNHVSVSVVGPLKANWTQPCPLLLSKQQQREQCWSTVESVWGSELLAKLEAIKAKVDPDGRFDCHLCVGEKE